MQLSVMILIASAYLKSINQSIAQKFL